MIYIENNLEKQDVFIPRNDGSTCYVSPYDKGYQDGYQDGLDDCGAGCTLQEKEVTVTATTQTVRPDDGYVGMDVVNINASQFVLEKYTEGYHDGEENGAEEQKSKLTSTAFTENGVYRREDGWNEVEVVVEQTGTTCNLESKTETVTADTQTILPSSGYDGMSEVVVDATNYGQDKYDEGFADGQASVPPCPPCPEIESAVTYGIGSGFTGATITPSSGYDGMAEVTITDNGYGQEKYDEGHGDGYNEGFTDGQTDILSGMSSTAFTQNDTYTNPNGWSAVTVNVPQTGSSCNLEDKSVVLTGTSETVLPSSGYDGMSSVEVDASNMVADLYNEGYEDGYDDGRTLNLQHKNATQTATTQTHYPDNTNGSLTIIGEANIPTNFIPYTAYTGNSNYLRIEIDNVWNGRKGSDQYLYTVLSGDTRFSCERFRIDNYPYLNIGNTTGLGTGPENGTEFHTWAVVLDNGTVTSYIDGVVSRTGSFVGAPSNTALVFAPPTDARNLNATFYSVKFKDANGNLIAEFVPNNHNGGAIKDTVSNTIYDKTGSGIVTFNAGYDGMSAITVDASGLCQNYYNSGYTDGQSSVSCNLEQKSVTLTAATETITPSQGYDGMDEVSIDARELCYEYYTEGLVNGGQGNYIFIKPSSSVTLTDYGVYAFVYDSGVTIPSMLVNFNYSGGTPSEIKSVVEFENCNVKTYENFLLYNTNASTSTLDRIEIDDVVYTGGTTFTGNAVKFVYYFNGDIPDEFFMGWTTPDICIEARVRLFDTSVGRNAFKNLIWGGNQLFAGIMEFHVIGNCTFKTGAFDNAGLRSILFIGTSNLTFETNSIVGNQSLHNITIDLYSMSSFSGDSTLFYDSYSNGALYNDCQAIPNSFFSNTNWFVSNLQPNGWVITRHNNIPYH